MHKESNINATIYGLLHMRSTGMLRSMAFANSSIFMRTLIFSGIPLMIVFVVFRLLVFGNDDCKCLEWFGDMAVLVIT